MRVLMVLMLMCRVLMLMGPMFPGMVVIMHMDVGAMLMEVRMVVKVLMGMGVNMVVGMPLISMPVFMSVFMGVFVGMQVLVFVLAFHDRSLPGYSSEPEKVDLNSQKYY